MSGKIPDTQSQPDHGPCRLSIAIATLGREHYLIETLESVLEFIEADMELIVVDQTLVHLTETQSRLDQWASEGSLQYLRLPSPGLTRARNVALQVSQSPIVLFLDDDVILSPGLLLGHLAHFENSRVGAVAGQEFHYRASSMRPSFDDPTLASCSTFMPREQRGGPVSKFGGANHSIRRVLAIEIGGYDEGLVGSAFGEDYDMSMRIQQAGFIINYDPKLEVIHRLAPSGGCRVPGNRLMPEWCKTASYWLSLFRYGWPKGQFWKVAVCRQFRAGPLRRENFVNPVRWPNAWYSFVRAMLYGWKRRSRVTSPFDTCRPR